MKDASCSSSCPCPAGRYVLARVESSPEAATSAVQPGVLAAAAGAGAAGATPTKRKQGVPDSSCGGSGGTAIKRSRLTPLAAAPSVPTPVAAAAAVNGGGAGSGGADLQALFMLRENNEVG
jgi:hypothetical protein